MPHTNKIIYLVVVNQRSLRTPCLFASIKLLSLNSSAYRLHLSSPVLIKIKQQVICILFYVLFLEIQLFVYNLLYVNIYWLLLSQKVFFGFSYHSYCYLLSVMFKFERTILFEYSSRHKYKHPVLTQNPKYWFFTQLTNVI